MAQIITPKKHRLQVADIFRTHIGDYQNAYPLWPQHKKIVTDLLNCRTAHLGGYVERCNTCGSLRITYHSLCKTLFHQRFFLGKNFFNVFLGSYSLEYLQG
jgi:hypothetical protein